MTAQRQCLAVGADGPVATAESGRTGLLAFPRLAAPRHGHWGHGWIMVMQTTASGERCGGRGGALSVLQRLAAVRFGRGMRGLAMVACACGLWPLSPGHWPLSEARPPQRRLAPFGRPRLPACCAPWLPPCSAHGR